MLQKYKIIFLNSVIHGHKKNIQKLIKEKNVKVNSTVIKSNYKVAKGDQIQITIPDLTEPDILPENIPLDILYEDDDILVVNKPKVW